MFCPPVPLISPPPSDDSKPRVPRELLSLAQAPLSPTQTCYRLTGLIQHRGSRFGGHYVAYVQDKDGWKHASDSAVRTATLPEVNACEVSAHGRVLLLRGETSCCRSRSMVVHSIILCPSSCCSHQAGSLTFPGRSRASLGSLIKARDNPARVPTQAQQSSFFAPISPGGGGKVSDLLSPLSSRPAPGIHALLRADGLFRRRERREWRWERWWW